jgi:hypothetical protein
MTIDPINGTDLPFGYRWATSDEMEGDLPEGWILVPLTQDANGRPYTEDEADVAVPITLEDFA